MARHFPIDQWLWNPGIVRDVLAGRSTPGGLNWAFAWAWSPQGSTYWDNMSTRPELTIAARYHLRRMLKSHTTRQWRLRKQAASGRPSPPKPT